jgi:hypothetical protein
MVAMSFVQLREKSSNKLSFFTCPQLLKIMSFFFQISYLPFLFLLFFNPTLKLWLYVFFFREETYTFSLYFFTTEIKQYVYCSESTSFLLQGQWPPVLYWTSCFIFWP